MRKFLSMFLTVVMFFSAIPFTTAFADDASTVRKNVEDVVPYYCETNSIYFYATENIRGYVGVYWYDGSYNCDLEENMVDGSGFPGYIVTKTENADKNIYRADIPKDVEKVMFTDIRCPDYEAVTSDLFVENDVKKIFVYDPLPPFSEIGKLIHGGWFFYYGDGKYGMEATLKEAEKKHAVYSGGEFPKGYDYFYVPEITKKENTVKVNVKTKTVRAKKLRKKAQKIRLITVRNYQGELSFELIKSSVKKKLRSRISISKKGVIKIKKWHKPKKGTYKIKVKVTAKGNSEYNSKIITKTVAIKIK